MQAKHHDQISWLSLLFGLNFLHLHISNHHHVLLQIIIETIQVFANNHELLSSAPLRTIFSACHSSFFQTSEICIYTLSKEPVCLLTYRKWIVHIYQDVQNIHISHSKILACMPLKNLKLELMPLWFDEVRKWKVTLSYYFTVLPSRSFVAYIRQIVLSCLVILLTQRSIHVPQAQNFIYFL